MRGGGRQFSPRKPRSGNDDYGNKFRGSNNSYREGKFQKKNHLNIIFVCVDVFKSLKHDPFFWLCV